MYTEDLAKQLKTAIEKMDLWIGRLDTYPNFSSVLATVKEAYGTVRYALRAIIGDNSYPHLLQRSMAAFENAIENTTEVSQLPVLKKAFRDLVHACSQFGGNVGENEMTVPDRPSILATN
ncbi:MAG TPA: hypothetical protein VIM11_15540 [Tepidisphaeraceae bacterium]|jgi:hypothetical protein